MLLNSFKCLVELYTPHFSQNGFLMRKSFKCFIESNTKLVWSSLLSKCHSWLELCWPPNSAPQHSFWHSGGNGKAGIGDFLHPNSFPGINYVFEIRFRRYLAIREYIWNYLSSSSSLLEDHEILKLKFIQLYLNILCAWQSQVLHN